MKKSLLEYDKSDWLSANMHGELDPETDIYRIFRTDYLLSDIAERKNTLVNPCYETQGDDLENPLKNLSFIVEGGRHQLFRGIMAEYYSQSWSLSNASWAAFGEGHDVVRVRTKVGKLFDRLMNEADPFYSLYYHIGRITYDDSQRIRDNLTNIPYEDFLDSLGYGLLKTIMKIRKNFEDEEEVRLVYIRSPREGYDTPNQHPVFGNINQFCAHYFDWNGIIDDYEFRSTNIGPNDQIAAAIDSTIS